MVLINQTGMHHQISAGAREGEAEGETEDAAPWKFPVGQMVRVTKTGRVARIVGITPWRHYRLEGDKDSFYPAKHLWPAAQS